MQSLSVSFFLVIFHHFQKVTRDITLITPCPRLLFFGQGKETWMPFQISLSIKKALRTRASSHDQPARGHQEHREGSCKALLATSARAAAQPEREGAHTNQEYVINQHAVFPSKANIFSKYKKNFLLAPVVLDCHRRNIPHDKSHMGIRIRCFNSLNSHQAIFQMADPSVYENQRHLQADLRSHYPKVKTQYNIILTNRTGINY